MDSEGIKYHCEIIERETKKVIGDRIVTEKDFNNSPSSSFLVVYNERFAQWYVATSFRNKHKTHPNNWYVQVTQI